MRVWAQSSRELRLLAWMAWLVRLTDAACPGCDPTDGPLPSLSVPWPALSSLSRNAPLLPHPPLLSLSPATKNGLTVNNTREILLYKCNKLLYEVLKSTLGLMVFWEMLIQTITCFSFYFATTKQTHTRIVVMDTREQLLSWGQTPQITPHIKRSFPLNCIVT